MNKIKTCILLILLILSCSSPTLNKEASDHFDGKKFFNPDFPNMSKSIFTLLKWKLTSKAANWPKSVKIDQQLVKNKKVPLNELSVTFINHATVLLQIDGLNILTDPIWSDRTSPVSFAGPKRVKKPGVKFDNIPKIDVILISHNHYDHMDIPTLERFIKRDSPIVLAGLGSSHYFKDKYKSKVLELDWSEDYFFKGLRFTFLPSKHWSKRTAFDENKCLWGAFAIEGSKKIYFAGDTGYADHFKNAAETFESFYLSLIPIGAYEPRWFMKDAHMNPEEAIKAHLDLKSKYSLGIHHGTFQLTDEGINRPVEELKKAKEKYGVGDEFFVLENGVSKEF